MGDQAPSKYYLTPRVAVDCNFVRVLSIVLKYASERSRAEDKTPTTNKPVGDGGIIVHSSVLSDGCPLDERTQYSLATIGTIIDNRSAGQRSCLHQSAARRLPIERVKDA